MCLLQTNATAETGFAALNRGEKANKYERTLAELAEGETIEMAGGLENRLDPLSSWRDDPVLRGVRKYRQGGHRFYIRGRHTECHYFLCWIKVNKRDEEDREEDPRFQQKILAALAEPPMRTLTAPAPQAQLPAITLPAQLLERAFGQGDQAARQALVETARRALIAAHEAADRAVPGPQELDRLAQTAVGQAEARYWETAHRGTIPP